MFFTKLLAALLLANAATMVLGNLLSLRVAWLLWLYPVASSGRDPALARAPQKTPDKRDLGDVRLCRALRAGARSPAAALPYGFFP